MNPSDVGIQDRVVIQELLKNIAQTQNVAVTATHDKEDRKKAFKGEPSELTPIFPPFPSAAYRAEFESRTLFPVVILTEVDRLSRDAQHALRRTMEKYMQSCRLILVCNSTTKVIPAIRSRCLGIRVPAPSTTEIVRLIRR